MQQFGDYLRQWRTTRRMSQLDLGLEAEVSARHISFLESGRSKPSRSMVLQLAETLSVPRAARNTMLNAAGFRALYQERGLADAMMAPVRAALDHLLAGHDPYPGFAIDRHWNIKKANRMGAQLLAASQIPLGGNMLDALIDPDRIKPLVENWGELVAHMVTRLRTESAHFGGDPVLDAAIAALSRDPALADFELDEEMPPIALTHYRLGDQRFSVFSTLAQFGSAEDIALADLRIELLFPADADTRSRFEALAEMMSVEEVSQ
ncbi:MAG: helix-turn-helix transcriptional regulator [Pseudomonadota bacterium]